MNMNMNNPSAGIAPALRRHVHLVCNHPYAIAPTPNLDLALRYLLEAPRVVRDHSTMSWKVFHDPPRDGTVMLVWQPPQAGHLFASDGYVYSDPERAYSQAKEGYSLEMFVQVSGFRPGLENMTTHARRRYHLVPNGSAGPNTPQIDPSLWLVHYLATDMNSRIPTQKIQLNEQSTRMLQERNSLFGGGRYQLLYKEFMLMDRGNWPVINLPGPMPGANTNHPAAAQQPLNYPNNVAAQMNAPVPNTPGAHQIHGTPQSNHVPGAVPGAPQLPMEKRPPGVTDPAVDTSGSETRPLDVTSMFENEEAATGLDFMDTLTPSQISRARYYQHSQWMGQVLGTAQDHLSNKPYNGDTSKSSVSKPIQEEAPPPTEVQDLQIAGMSPSQLATNNNSQMEKMRKQHESRMKRLKRSDVWKDAELKLRAEEALLHDPEAPNILLQSEKIAEMQAKTLGAVAQVETQTNGKVETLAQVQVIRASERDVRPEIDEEQREQDSGKDQVEIPGGDGNSDQMVAEPQMEVQQPDPTPQAQETLQIVENVSAQPEVKDTETVPPTTVPSANEANSGIDEAIKEAPEAPVEQSAATSEDVPLAPFTSDAAIDSVTLSKEQTPNAMNETLPQAETASSYPAVSEAENTSKQTQDTPMPDAQDAIAKPEPPTDVLLP